VTTGVTEKDIVPEEVWEKEAVQDPLNEPDQEPERDPVFVKDPDNEIVGNIEAEMVEATIHV
jgi:hypothetical protein